MSVWLCMKQIGLPCSGRPQRGHRIFFSDQRQALGANAFSFSYLSLSLSFSASHSASHSLSLPPSFPPLHLSLYYLISSKKALKVKKRHSLTCHCLGKVIWQPAAPQTFIAAPTSLGPTTLCLGLCRVLSTSIVRSNASSLPRKSLVLKIWFPEAQQMISAYLLGSNFGK